MKQCPNCESVKVLSIDYNRFVDEYCSLASFVVNPEQFYTEKELIVANGGSIELSILYCLTCKHHWNHVINIT